MNEYGDLNTGDLEHNDLPTSPVPEGVPTSKAGVQLEMIGVESSWLFRFITEFGIFSYTHPEDVRVLDLVITPEKIDEMVASLKLTAEDLREVLLPEVPLPNEIVAFACRRGSYRSAIGTEIAEGLGKKVIRNDNPDLGSTREPDELGYGFGLDCIADKPGSLALDSEGFLVIGGKRVDHLVIFLDFELNLDFNAFDRFLEIYNELDPDWLGRTKITVFEGVPEIFVGGLLLAFPSPNIEAFPEVHNNTGLRYMTDKIKEAWDKP